MYAFTFECFDQGSMDDEGYRPNKRSVDVSIVAKNSEQALELVKTLVERETYKLDRISELNELQPVNRNW